MPVSVKLSHFGAHDAGCCARLVFHKLMQAIADATAPWDRAQAAASDAAPPPSASDARLGPGGDPAEGKR